MCFQATQAQGGSGSSAGVNPQQAGQQQTGGGLADILSQLFSGMQNNMSQNTGQGGSLLQMLLGQNQPQQNVNVPAGGNMAQTTGTSTTGAPTDQLTQLLTLLTQAPGATPQSQGAQGDIGGTSAGMNPANYLMSGGNSGGGPNVS